MPRRRFPHPASLCFARGSVVPSGEEATGLPGCPVLTGLPLEQTCSRLHLPGSRGSDSQTAPPNILLRIRRC